MIYKNGVPYSAEFDDIYFDAFDPILERSSVYASALDEVSNDEIIIAECGFGFGLNFFVSAKKALFLGKKLHYISAEKNPILLNDLKEFYARILEFQDIFNEFALSYEIIYDEILRIKIADEKIILDIYFGDIFEWLKQSNFKADIWYIDGFSPSKNKEPWSQNFLNLVSQFSKKNAILRSFCCARVFKDSLLNSGFFVSKRIGQGKKREFLHAICQNPQDYKAEFQPWFERNSRILTYKKILVIGAGISGMICAFKLRKLGFEVIIIDENESVLNGASSNVSGLMLPLINKPSSLLGKFHLCAFLNAFDFYKKNDIFANFVDFCAAWYYACDDEELNRFKMANSNILRFNENSVFVPKAVQISPLALRKELARILDISFNTKFKKLQKYQNGYKVEFENSRILEVDAVIFAGGANGKDIVKSFDEQILLSNVRGQTTHLAPFSTNAALPLSKLGYICKANDGLMVVGSSFDRNDLSLEKRASDDEENIKKISEFMSENSRILGSNVGLRNYASDRFIIGGQLHDESAFRRDYKALLWTKNKSEIQPKPSYLDGVFTSTGHGAHGLSTAVMGAEIIADLLLNRPLCITKSLFGEVHPARFLIRALKKGKISANL